MIKIILILLSIAYLANGANILFFFGLSTYSHRITVWPLAEKLAEKGHKVTFVQPFLPKTPNPKISEFFPEELRATLGGIFDRIDFLSLRLSKGIEGIHEIAQTLPGESLKICAKFLQHSETQEWLKKSKFDLVVIDGLVNECGFGLAHKFKAKTIIYGTTHPFIWWHDVFGIVPESSWTSELHLSYQYPMSFWERTVSTILPLVVHYQKQNDYYPQLDELFRGAIDSNIPAVAELEKGASLIFTNSHFSEELARSLPPLVVPIGGIHCQDSTQKLPKELGKFITDSGVNGFIYVSFGSAAKISTAPQEFQDIFFHALGNSTTRFVWKYEGKRPSNMPANVFTDNWMPQQAILSQPNIKAFLTHGGLLGIQEAVWHGVPLLAMPIFAEQDYNAFRIQRTQRGLMLDPNKLTQSKLEDAIAGITKDPKYKRNMVELSKKFRDRPASPLETAVWWTEYVLRHDDTLSMKPLGIQQSWYERRLLDVWAFIYTLVLVAILLVFYILKKLLSIICCGSSSKSALPATAKGKAKPKAKKH